MEERITLCGDNCIECPRYTSHNVCTYGLVDCTEKHGVEKCN